MILIVVERYFTMKLMVMTLAMFLATQSCGYATQKRINIIEVDSVKSYGSSNVSSIAYRQDGQMQHMHNFREDIFSPRFDVAQEISDDGSVVCSSTDEEFQLLRNIVELRLLFCNKYFTIKPGSEAYILEYIKFHPKSFKCFEEGVFVSNWNISCCMVDLSDILHTFTYIKRFKIELVWDTQEHERLHNLLSNILHFYSDLQELYLVDCQLNNDQLKQIICNLPCPEKLQILDVRNNLTTRDVEEEIRKIATGLLRFMLDENNLSLQSFQHSHALPPPLIHPVFQPNLQSIPIVEEENPCVSQDELIMSEVQELKADELVLDIIKRGALIRVSEKGRDIVVKNLSFEHLLNRCEWKKPLSLFSGDRGHKDITQSLQVYLGYKQNIIYENRHKVEVWIVPRFIVETNLDKAASHYQPIWNQWTSPIGIFFTWGSHAPEQYDYIVDKNLEDINRMTLYELFIASSQEKEWDIDCQVVEQAYTRQFKFLFATHT